MAQTEGEARKRHAHDIARARDICARHREGVTVPGVVRGLRDQRGVVRERGDERDERVAAEEPRRRVAREVRELDGEVEGGEPPRELAWRVCHARLRRGAHVETPVRERRAPVRGPHHAALPRPQAALDAGWRAVGTHMQRDADLGADTRIRYVRRGPFGSELLFLLERGALCAGVWGVVRGIHLDVATTVDACRLL